jgi:hypothetical protein
MPSQSNPKTDSNPKGAGRRRRYRLKNGEITEDQILLHAPKETIPEKAYDRFLELCDEMIIMLDAKTVNNADLEEIAKYYRDSIVVEKIYETLADPESADAGLDVTLVNQLEKITKQLEKRKENLSIRARYR